MTAVFQMLVAELELVLDDETIILQEKVTIPISSFFPPSATFPYLDSLSIKKIRA